MADLFVVTVIMVTVAMVVAALVFHETGVASNLVDKQPTPCQTQQHVGRSGEALKGLRRAPQRKEAQHDCECSDLPQLHPHIERQDAHHDAVIAKLKLLKAGRQPKAVDQPEDEDHHQQVGHLHLQDALESIEVLEALVDDAQSDDRVDQPGVGGDSHQGGTQQGDAVAQGEGRDEAHDVADALEEEDDPEEEQQVVVAGDHVLCAQPDVVEQSTLGHGRARRLGHPMGVGQ